MKIIIFNTVIRTRKSLENILIAAIREGKDKHQYFEQFLHIYNTGFFGLVFYRTSRKMVGKQFFIDKTNKYETKIQ